MAKKSCSFASEAAVPAGKGRAGACMGPALGPQGVDIMSTCQVIQRQASTKDQENCIIQDDQYDLFR